MIPSRLGFAAPNDMADDMSRTAFVCAIVQLRQSKVFFESCLKHDFLFYKNNYLNIEII